MLLHDNRKANALCYHKSERSCVDSKNLQSPRNFHAHNYDAAQLISLFLDEDVMCSLIPSRVISNFRKLAYLFHCRGFTCIGKGSLQWDAVCSWHTSWVVIKWLTIWTYSSMAMWIRNRSHKTLIGASNSAIIPKVHSDATLSASPNWNNPNQRD